MDGDVQHADSLLSKMFRLTRKAKRPSPLLFPRRDESRTSAVPLSLPWDAPWPLVYPDIGGRPAPLGGRSSPSAARLPGDTSRASLPCSTTPRLSVRALSRMVCPVHRVCCLNCFRYTPSDGKCQWGDVCGKCTKSHGGGTIPLSVPPVGDGGAGWRPALGDRGKFSSHWGMRDGGRYGMMVK